VSTRAAGRLPLGSGGPVPARSLCFSSGTCGVPHVPRPTSSGGRQASGGGGSGREAEGHTGGVGEAGAKVVAGLSISPSGGAAGCSEGPDRLVPSTRTSGNGAGCAADTGATVKSRDAAASVSTAVAGGEGTGAAGGAERAGARWRLRRNHIMQWMLLPARVLPSMTPFSGWRLVGRREGAAKQKTVWVCRHVCCWHEPIQVVFPQQTC